MMTTDSLPKSNLPVNSFFDQSLLPQSYTCLDERHRWRTVIQKCSCQSSWCPLCWSKSSSKKSAMSRLSTFKPEYTRQVILTVDPEKFNHDPKLAFETITSRRSVGELIKNLQRVKHIHIVDWILFLEWHKNGFPHWHILIQVDKPGKAGMIGQDILHQYWSHGAIREEYFRDEFHWKNTLGYFSSHGYFENDKHHQTKLPEWALLRDTRIKRYETMKQKSGVCVDHTHTSDIHTSLYTLSSLSTPSKSPMRPYKVILENCGASTRFLIKSPLVETNFTLHVPYRGVKSWGGWEYREGKGLTQTFSNVEFMTFYDTMKRIESILPNIDESYRGVEGANERTSDLPLRSKSGDEPVPPTSEVPVLVADELNILMAIYGACTLRDDVYVGA
jgi:hypothetical protein